MTKPIRLTRDGDEITERRPRASMPSHVSDTSRYEQLDGGVGREINFRPTRHTSAELGPVGAFVAVRIGDAMEHAELHDVSQNGVAFEWHGPEFSVGDTITELVVRFDRHEAYHGEARVGSVRTLGDKRVVGASFLDTLMNVDDVLLLRDVKAWS